MHEICLAARGGDRLRPEPMEAAWQWATRLRRSTTALLQPTGDGQAVVVFDYLVDAVQRRAGPARQVSEHVINIALAYASGNDLGTLGETAYSQGRYAIAAAAAELAVAAWRASVGDEHPATLASRNNLALAFAGLGRLEEAERAQRAVLQARQRVLGEEHPDTLTSRNNLAVVLAGLRRLEEAERAQRAVLQARQRVLGEEHPDTLASRNNLAVVLAGLGRLEEAESEQRAVLQARRRVLGAEHPDTQASRDSLAAVLSELERRGGQGGVDVGR